MSVDEAVKSSKRWYAASGYGDVSHTDIMLFSADSRGKMEIRDALIQGDSPSFLCKMGDHIYAASEQNDRAAITSYRISNYRLIKEKTLELGGAGLCHLEAGDGVLYASCYESGELYAADQDLNWEICCYRGSERSHIHCSALWDCHTLFAADLGEDQIIKIRLQDGKTVQKIEKINMKCGSGPRQILLDKKRKSAVVINELDNTAAFGSGLLWYEKLQTQMTTKRQRVQNYPGGSCMNNCGELFLANRGEDTITVFDSIHRYLGEWNCHGHWPRHVLYSDHGIVFVACERSNTVNSFLWDGHSLAISDSLELAGAACVIELQTDGVMK